MAAPLIFNSAEIAQRRLNKRRFLFFSCAFVLTSLATWVMADLLWQDGITGLEIAP